MIQRRTSRRLVTLACALLAVSMTTSGCGYALAGRGSFLPEYIKIVGIPEFTNNSTVFDINRVLTDRVRTEFSSRGKYTVQPNVTTADAILTGTITNVTLRNTAYTASSQASRVAITVIAAFEFRDVRDNKVLWSSPAMSFQEEYEPTSAVGADASAFFGQDANALERLSQNFARSLVTSILEAF